MTCGSLVFEVQYLEVTVSMNLKKNLYRAGKHISCVQPIIAISSECPLHTLGVPRVNFNMHHYKNFIGLHWSKSI